MNPALPRTIFYKDTPNPVEMAFDKGPWCWYRFLPDGSPVAVAGVTTVLKCIHKPALLPWGIRVCLEKMKALLIEGHYVITPEIAETFPLYEGSLDEIIQAARKTDSEILTDSGEVGTSAHDFLEKIGQTYIRGDEARRLELLAHFPEDDRAASCAISALEFFQRHHIQFIHTERPVYSRSLDCCGTMDALVWADSCDDPACCPEPYEHSLTLLDYKSSNGVYPSYMAQAALYAYAFMEEFPGQHIDRRFVLKLPKTEGAFQSFHMAGDELFRQDLAIYTFALGLYRSLRIVEERMSDLAAEAKAIRQAAETKADDARQAIKCDKADEYVGKRLKKGCNGTNKMCDACTAIYAAKHVESGHVPSDVA
jgi:hypothetical protein